MCEGLTWAGAPSRCLWPAAARGGTLTVGRCSRSSSGTFSGTRPAAGGTFRSPACPAGGWGTGGTPGSQWPVRTGVPLSPSAHRAEGLARTLRWVPAPGAEDRVSPGPPDGVPGAPSSCRLPLATSGLSPPRTPAREGGVADGTPRTASCRPSMVQHETRPPPAPRGLSPKRETHGALFQNDGLPGGTGRQLGGHPPS